MHSPLNHYAMLARRWAWVIVLGIIICGGVTYIVSKFTRPTYQASAIFVVNVDPTSSTNATSSIAAVPTYAQLFTNPLILNPVVAKYQGMTLQQLSAMITVKPGTNTQLIELDVENGNPHLAAQLANEVGQSFLQYSNSQLPGTIQMLPAQVPSTPIKPKTLQDVGIGALIGLGLAVTLVVIFEWMEDHLSSPDEVQDLLAMDLLVTIPQSSDKQRKSMAKGSAALMEKYRMLAASLNTAQAIKPFKSVMITSALPGEGKSTVAANVASFLAITGKRVLLIDANLRHPILDQHFQLKNHRGLSNVFLEMWTSPRMELYGQETGIPTLRVLTSGIMPTKPTAASCRTGFSISRSWTRDVELYAVGGGEVSRTA